MPNRFALDLRKHLLLGPGFRFAEDASGEGTTGHKNNIVEMARNLFMDEQEYLPWSRSGGCFAVACVAPALGVGTSVLSSGKAAPYREKVSVTRGG